MQHYALVLVFLLGLVLKASTVMGEEITYERSSPDQSPVPMMVSHSPATLPENSTTSSLQESEKSASSPIQYNNNINVAAPAMQSPQTASNPNSSVAYRNDDPASVLGTAESRENRGPKVALIPMVGGTWFATRWNNHITNRYSFGLALEVPVSYNFAFEVEGGYGKYSIGYSDRPPFVWKHDFNMYNVGGNLKVYVVRGVLNPYVGAGISGIYYENMSRGPMAPGQNYNQWIGSGELMGGADIALGEGIAIGGRAAWLIPMFNRPRTVDNGFASAPYYEEAGAINTSFYKLMATVRVAL